LLKISLLHADDTVTELMVPAKDFLSDVVLVAGKVFLNSGQVEVADASIWFHECQHVYRVDALLLPARDLIEASRVSFAEEKLEGLRDLLETEGARVRAGLQKALDAIERHAKRAAPPTSKSGRAVADEAARLREQIASDIDHIRGLLQERRAGAEALADKVVTLVMRAWRDACGLPAGDGAEFVERGTGDRFEAGLKAVKKLRGRIVRELMR
jgi:uncharacterized protein YicC (UPF0701 family)